MLTGYTEPGTNRFSTSSLTHFHHEQVSEPLYGHIYDVHTPSYKMDNITWGHNAIDDPVPIHGLSFCETGLPSRSGLSSNFVHAASRGSQVRFSGYASHDNTLTGKSSTTTNIQDWRWNVTDVKQVTGYCLGGQTRNKRDTKTKRSSASGSSGKIASRAHLQHSKNWKGDKSEVGRKYAGLLREYNECRSSFGHLKMCEATW